LQIEQQSALAKPAIGESQKWEEEEEGEGKVEGEREGEMRTYEVWGLMRSHEDLWGLVRTWGRQMRSFGPHLQMAHFVEI
jgi:hypothetical protein